MTETTPDYAELIKELRNHEERWECAGGGGWETPEVCIQAANALRTLLESNKELKAERDQLLDKLHCMCGSPIDHSAWEEHTPVSVYDYSLEQERSRAEDAEARLAEALKALAEVRRRARNIWGACSSDQIIDKDVERQAKLMLEYIDACLEKGNSDGE